MNGPDPGDGDGSVVKGTQAPAFTPAGTGSSTTMRNTKTTVATLSIWKAYLTALRLGYGWRWLW